MKKTFNLPLNKTVNIRYGVGLENSVVANILKTYLEREEFGSHYVLLTEEPTIEYLNTPPCDYDSFVIGLPKKLGNVSHNTYYINPYINETLGKGNSVVECLENFLNISIRICNEWDTFDCNYVDLLNRVYKLDPLHKEELWLLNCQDCCDVKILPNEIRVYVNNLNKDTYYNQKGTYLTINGNMWLLGSNLKPYTYSDKVVGVISVEIPPKGNTCAKVFAKEENYARDAKEYLSNLGFIDTKGTLDNNTHGYMILNDVSIRSLLYMLSK